MIKIDPRDKKWKVMVVLDSCRYDYFKEVNFIKGKLTEVNSESVDTMGWYTKHWANKDNSDTILIHGIYFVERFGPFFFASFRMWNYENMLKLDEQIEYAKKVLDDIPTDKRVIIHFLQPHIPFNSPTGRELLKRIGTSGRGMPEDHDLITAYGNKNGWEEITNAYKEEIRYVLGKLDDSEIKIDIITSDHGIRIGEDKIYRHGASHPKVHSVPWLEVER